MFSQQSSGLLREIMVVSARVSALFPQEATWALMSWFHDNYVVAGIQ